MLRIKYNSHQFSFRIMESQSSTSPPQTHTSSVFHRSSLFLRSTTSTTQTLAETPSLVPLHHAQTQYPHTKTEFNPYSPVVATLSPPSRQPSTSPAPPTSPFPPKQNQNSPFSPQAIHPSTRASQVSSSRRLVRDRV